MADIAYIILFALIGMVVFKKVGLPGILGMIAAGILLGPSGFDLINPEIHAVLKEFKTVALIVILFRAGLGIDKKTLNRIGGPALKMGLLPAIIEGITITTLAYCLLNFPFYAAGMLGFMIAAVSPAIVVPFMLEFKEAGYGTKKGVPTLILAGASLDDIAMITVFGVFASLAAGGAANWTFIFVGVPLGIILGVVIGIILGFLAVWFFRKYHMRDTLKVIVLMIAAVIFYDLAEIPVIKNFLPIAALLGIMTIGFVLLEKYSKVANKMSEKFNKVWVLAEILLFVYIGTEVRISAIDFSLIGIGILILTIGLIARSFGVWISLMGSELNRKEKLFSVMAYWPKATVQAAMGAIPLTLIQNGQITDLSKDIGLQILSIAVLGIIFTAPLGAISLKLTGKKLLDK